jgi:hypothetical protein
MSNPRMSARCFFTSLLGLVLLQCQSFAVTGDGAQLEITKEDEGLNCLLGLVARFCPDVSSSDAEQIAAQLASGSKGDSRLVRVANASRMLGLQSGEVISSWAEILQGLDLSSTKTAVLEAGSKENASLMLLTERNKEYFIEHYPLLNAKVTTEALVTYLSSRMVSACAGTRTLWGSCVEAATEAS